MDIGPLLQQVKEQLHEEADYLREGAALRRYRGLLAEHAEHADYGMPEVHDAFTTASVLTMTRMDGVPVESVVRESQEERDRIGRLLIALLFRELFEFRFIQTDPNLANYRYERDTGRLTLLDFGATRAYSIEMVAQYRQILTGAIRRDPAVITPAAIALNYFDDNTSAEHRDAVLAMFMDVCEPLRLDGPYDFGQSDLAARLQQSALALGMERDFWHTPVADVLLLHRKMAGLYMLAAKLGARVNVRQLLQACVPTF